MLRRDDFVSVQSLAPAGPACDEATLPASPLLRELEQQIAHIDVVVSCIEHPDAWPADLVRRCLSAGIPFVDATLHGNGALVTSIPGARSHPSRGCPACAARHVADRGASLAGARAFAEPDLAAIRDLVILSVCEIVDMSRGRRTPRTQAIDLDVERRSVRVEVLRPHHACGICRPSGGTSAVGALREAAEWHRALGCEDAGPAPDLGILHERLQPLVGERFGTFAALARTSEVARHGVWKFFRARGVNPKRNALANAHAAAAVRNALYRDRSVAHISEGLDFDDPSTAESLALIEGLERLFAMSHCEPARVVEAPFARLGADAFDPRELPLFADWQYAQPAIGVQPFDAERTIRWVGAVDLASGRPMLVPFDFVYDDGSMAAIYRANSNGAACHGSTRQALVNAIYEVVERDALMSMWLHRLSAPRLASERLRSDPWDVRATLGKLDFQLEHVDVTVDTRIPVWLAVLRDHRNPALFLINMVACLDPERRLRKLYRELAQFAYPYLVDQAHFVTERTCDPDPDNVRTFADHLAYYQSPERNREAAFLTASPQVSVTRLDAHDDAPSADRELDVLLQRLTAGGFRVLAVDCTSPLLASVGLKAVKVLIPGLVPLNAQHRLRTLVGERLMRLPERLGVPAADPAATGLNPLPHPFW